MPFKIIDCDRNTVELQDTELKAVLRVQSMNRIPHSYKGYSISATYKQVDEGEAIKIRDQLNKRNLAAITN